MTGTLITILLSLFLASGLLGWMAVRRLASLRRDNDRLGRELTLLRQQLDPDGLNEEEEPEELPTVALSAERPPFAAGLVEAGLRLRLQAGDPGGEIPEKYRLVVAMIRRGLAARDISDLLRISPAEVEQLMRLARVSPPAGGARELRRSGKADQPEMAKRPRLKSGRSPLPTAKAQSFS
jgi:hypothetical protein